MGSCSNGQRGSYGRARRAGSQTHQRLLSFNGEAVGVRTDGDVTPWAFGMCMSPPGVRIRERMRGRSL